MFRVKLGIILVKNMTVIGSSLRSMGTPGTSTGGFPHTTLIPPEVTTTWVVQSKVTSLEPWFLLPGSSCVLLEHYQIPHLELKDSGLQ